MANEQSFTTTKFLGNNPVDTCGWDTVYAMKAGLINESLMHHFREEGEHSPKLEFEHYLDPEKKIGIKGRFGPWQITPGGSGTRINLSLPIVEGTMWLTGMPFGTEPFDLAGVVLPVSATLGYHAVAATVAEDGSANQKAVLKIGTGASAVTEGSASHIQDPSTAPEANRLDHSHDQGNSVSVMAPEGLKFADDFLDGFKSAVLTFVQTLTNNWVHGNLEIFDYVFLSLDVAETAAHGEWTWIRPTYVGYAYTDIRDDAGNASVKDSIFSILAMTEGRLPGTQPDGSKIVLSDVVSPAVIPTNADINAAFVIQPKLLMQKILLRNLPALFEGADESYFEMSSDSLMISNKEPLTFKIAVDAFMGWIDSHCVATIPKNAFQLTIDQDRITQTFTNISYPYGHTDELTVVLTLSSYSTLGVDEKKEFSMQYGRTLMSSMSVQPDSEQMAWDSIKSILWNVGITLVCCGIAGYLGRGVKAGAEAVTAAEKGVVETTTSIEKTAGEVVGKEISSGVEAVGKGAAKSMTLVSEEASMGVEAAGTELGESASAEISKPGVMKLRQFMPRLTLKTWCMFVGQFVGEGYNMWGNVDIARAYKSKPTEAPALINFLDNCISPAKWTNTGDQELIAAGLNNAFVIGFKVPHQPEKEVANDE